MGAYHADSSADLKAIARKTQDFDVDAGGPEGRPDAATEARQAVSLGPSVLSSWRMSSARSDSTAPAASASRTDANAATKRPRWKNARPSMGQRTLGSPPSAIARRSGPMASPARWSFIS